MNIPNDGGWGKPEGSGAPAGHGEGRNGPAGRFGAIPGKWTILACLILIGTLCFGIGLLAARENQPSKEPLWIEQLPPEELSGSVGTSTPDAAVSDKVSPNPKTLHDSANSQPAAAAAAVPQSKNYVASKTGTKYYLPTCGTAKRIKDTNKVWFDTKSAAEAAGYQPAANCKGI